jgi:WD40 repeat protein
VGIASHEFESSDGHQDGGTLTVEANSETPFYEYDAFISYSHRGDRELARSVERTLWRFGQPWYGIRGTRTYRDETNLSAHPDLWSSIRRGVEQSRCLLLLASPDSARSEWVPREVATAITRHGRNSVCTLLTAGVLPETDDISPGALAECEDSAMSKEVWDLLDAGEGERFVIDLRPFRDMPESTRQRDGEYLSRVASVAAKALQREKQDIWGHFYRAQRLRVYLLVCLAVVLLGLLAGLGFALRSARLATTKAVEAQKAEAKQRNKAEQAQIDAITQAKNAEKAKKAAETERAKALNALVRSDLQEGESRIEQGRSEEAAAYFARALRSSPESVVVKSWASDYIANGIWWLPKVSLQSKSWVTSAVFSPNGRRVLTTSQDQTAQVWDADSGKPLGAPMQHNGAVHDAVFSRDSQRVVTCSDQTAQVWNAASGKGVGAPMQPKSGVMLAVFSPSGRRVVTASIDGTAQVWDVDSGEPVGAPMQLKDLVHSAVISADGRRVLTVTGETAQAWDIDSGNPVGVPQGFFNFAMFSPDGRRVVTSSERTAQVWDVDSGKLVGAPMQQNGLADSAVFSPDGRRVLTTSRDQTAQVWDAESGKPVGTPMQHKSLIRSAVFSPDGRRVLTLGDEEILVEGVLGGREVYGIAQVWDADSGKSVGAPMQRKGFIDSAMFSPDGGRVLTVFADRSNQVAPHQTIQVWDADSGEPVGTPMQDSGYKISAMFSPDGRRRVLTAGLDRTARVWEAETARPPIQHKGSVNSAVFSPNGRRVVTASEDQTAQVWDVDSGKRVGTPMKHMGSVNSAVFSPNGRRVVTASEDQTAQVWDAESGKAVGTAMQHTNGPVHSAVFSPDGRRTLTAANRGVGLRAGVLGIPEVYGMAQVWDADSGKPVGAPMQSNGPDISALYSPDGRRIIAAGDEGVYWVHDVDSGKSVMVPMGIGVLFNSAAFSLDGRLMVIISMGVRAQIMDVDSGRPVGKPMVHRASINSAVFSPDARRVVTASSDQTAQVWDAGSGKPIGTPMQHKGKVNSAVFSPDGWRVVTASADGTARVWDADSGEPIGAPMRHKGPVNSAVFSPDGRRVITASTDRTAQVRDVLLDCCATRALVDRWATLLEAVGGYEIINTGYLSPLSMSEREKRLGELRDFSGAGRIAERSLDWFIRRFAESK